MRRFLRYVLTLITALCLFCTLAIVVGHADTRPDELQQLGFDECDGQPCYLGIVPGVTSWEEAKTRLANRPNFLYDVGGLMTLGDDFRAAEFFYNPTANINHGKVAEIQARNYAVSLGTLVARYGKPCQLGFDSINGNFEAVILHYPQIEAYFGSLGSFVVNGWRGTLNRK